MYKDHLAFLWTKDKKTTFFFLPPTKKSFSIFFPIFSGQLLRVTNLFCFSCKTSFLVFFFIRIYNRNSLIPWYLTISLNNFQLFTTFLVKNDELLVQFKVLLKLSSLQSFLYEERKFAYTYSILDVNVLNKKSRFFFWQTWKSRRTK